MMKQLIFMSALTLVSAMTGQAMANCNSGGTWSRVTNLVSTLQSSASNPLLGKTACDASAKYDTCTKHPGPNCIVQMGIQEEHHSDGTLWDFKCGPTGYPGTGPDTACFKPDTDRTSQVGKWKVLDDNTPNAEVSYSYGSGPFGPSLRVFFDSATSKYDFCEINVSKGIITLADTTGTSRVCP